MIKQKILFIDRDGTLIVEPDDQQIDNLEKLQFLPDVFIALTELKEAGYRFVLISNQDGLGTPDFPTENFELVQKMMIRVFISQGILFEAIRICPHKAQDGCFCRKPKVGLLLDYLSSQVIDLSNSYVIGDRITDLELAEQLGIQGILIGAKTTPGWREVRACILDRPRVACVNRKTRETEITLSVNLDNASKIEINTGIPFFNHMLEQLATHGKFGLVATIKGDLIVDDHHTVEDTALTLGQAIAQALGEKRGIGRYGFVLPMDEALAQVSLDLCGRAYFDFTGKFTREKIGDLSLECIPHFFRSFGQSLGASLHIRLTGENNHHMVEAMFKGVGRALSQALASQAGTIPSTKGVL